MDKKKKKEDKIKEKEIKSLDFNKAEYQEIILSNSNHPDKSFYERYL